eukprot:3627948-Lingulodinium_polyedra.AAC.1
MAANHTRLPLRRRPVLPEGYRPAGQKEQLWPRIPEQEFGNGSRDNPITVTTAVFNKHGIAALRIPEQRFVCSQSKRECAARPMAVATGTALAPALAHLDGVGTLEARLRQDSEGVQWLQK